MGRCYILATTLVDARIKYEVQTSLTCSLSLCGQWQGLVSFLQWESIPQDSYSQVSLVVAVGFLSMHQTQVIEVWNDILPPWEPLPPYQRTVLGTGLRVFNPRPTHGLWSQTVLIRGQGLINRHLFVKAQTPQCQIIKESSNLPSQTITYWESQGRKRQL